VERRAVAELIPYARNARTHSDAQVAQIAASVVEWGWTTPVLVDEAGGIIAGHGRVLAARKLGLADVPVMVASGWSEAQKRAYVLADNQLALNAGWDMDSLRVELQGIQDLEFSLDLAGFDPSQLANIFLEVREGHTDAAEEWEGMPEYEGLDPCYKKVVVNFDTEEDFQSFFRLLNQKCTDKTKSVWYPEKERRDLESVRWAEDEKNE
jgi:hypothetical protein